MIEPKRCAARVVIERCRQPRGALWNFCCKHCGLFPRMCSGCSKKISRQSKIVKVQPMR